MRTRAVAGDERIREKEYRASRTRTRARRERVATGVDRGRRGRSVIFARARDFLIFAGDRLWVPKNVPHYNDTVDLSDVARRAAITIDASFDVIKTFLSRLPVSRAFASAFDRSASSKLPILVDAQMVRRDTNAVQQKSCLGFGKSRACVVAALKHAREGHDMIRRESFE